MPLQRGNDLILGPIANGHRSLRMTASERETHFHIVGNTGSGKTKFLEHLIRQDIIANRTSHCGMLVLDPHGSLYDSIMAWMALKNIHRPIVPINLAHQDWVVAYNVLRKRQRASASVVVDAMIDAMAHVWGAANTDQTPRFARWAGNILHALYDNGYTLADAVHLVTNQVELREAMTAGVTDEMARRDWEMARTFKPREFEDEVSSTVSRLRRFVSNKHIRSMFGQSAKSFDFTRALEEGQIVLVNLSQQGCTISDENARLFGTLLINDLWTAAKERGKRDDVNPFYVYADEFQLFISPTIAASLDQSRGFGIHWTLSHQFPAQLRDEGENGRRVFQSVMENARSKACFSLSTRDNLQPMAEWMFTGVLDPDEIKHVLHSTKVLEYREELRRSYASGITESEGGTTHASRSWGESLGRAESFNSEFEMGGFVDSSNEQFSEAEGYTRSWSKSGTDSETVAPILIPVMGKELSSIQFRGLDEQIFRLMATLFDQEQRQCVVRLRGMRSPVALRTPFVEKSLIRQERVEEYIQQVCRRLPFVLPGDEARCFVEANTRTFAERVMTRYLPRSESDEPVTARRRIR